MVLQFYKFTQVACKISKYKNFDVFYLFETDYKQTAELLCIFVSIEIRRILSR